MKKHVRNRISLRVVLGAMFVCCTIITAVTAISLQYYFSSKKELEHTLNRYNTIAASVSQNLSNLESLAENAARSGAQLVSLTGIDFADKRIVIPLSELLARDSNLHSIFVAKSNNDFFQLISLTSEDVRARVGAKNSDRWLLVLHQGEGKQRRKTSAFYDENFKQTASKVEFSNFLPTQRSWYENASTERIYATTPYLFNTLKVNGESFTIKVDGSDTVVGIDVLLSSLEKQLTSRFVENKKNLKAESFIFGGDGQLIATNKQIDIEDRIPLVTPVVLTEEQQAFVKSAPELKVSNQNDWGPLDYTVGGRPNGFTIDLFKMISEMTGLKFKFVNGRSWDELENDFSQGNIDILQSISDPSDFAQMGILGEVLYRGNFALLTKQENVGITTLESIQNQRIGILRGWSIQDNLLKAFPNLTLISYPSLHAAIDDVESGNIAAVLDMKQILQSKVQEKFRQGLKIVPIQSPILPREFYYSIRKEYQELADIIDLAINSITPAQRQELREKWFTEGAAQSTFTYIPYPELLEFSHHQNSDNSAKLMTINGVEKYLYISKLRESNSRYFAVVVPQSYIMAGVHEAIFYSIGASLLVLLLLLPFAWLFAAPISKPINQLREQVQWIKLRQYSKVNRVHSRIEEIHQLGLSVIRGRNALQNFEEQQNQFFESMIQLVARAIDEKSAYTAGHCNRVPEIALMLAEAAEKSQCDKLKDFQFNNDEERREFRVAAWLHDCGKIATPEYVVDKGSKLETNYNRIHEVRMRFEVLWRDAQIQYLLSKLDSEVDLDNDLRPQLDKLREEFAFIANANIGGEFMSDQDIERLKQLAEQEWVRYFDCGLGLSPLEETRYHPQPTPAVEKLLADRPDHIVARDQPFADVTQFGINMTVPTHLYNHGEIYNLSVRRGTLSEEERFKINEHMISGIKMLESIPFPPELERVPRYATTHHETLIGTGYPRGLSREDLSIPERILVVADIFEALTASDRPYKKAKPLSEAIDILSKMVENGHIDKDIFELLLTSGVYQRYAKAYLPERLIDIENVDRYLKR
ncbi:HD domain-containing phosphohydrolase [Vibrio taketomensis]|uniref:HD domain-containing phosphohydrolase n=2 Tax=Vibrio taketomensis TaxID=2572923 RepID=UPI0013899185|nr:HD domain-containing phosphohydrolase [Vibrio taketomensis]